MSEPLYFEILDWLDGSEAIASASFFARLSAAYGIDHLVYADVERGPDGFHVAALDHTFDRHQAAGFAALGPAVLTACLGAAVDAIRPLDWNELARIEPDARLLAERAREVGAGGNALALPLPARGGHSALIGLASSLADREFHQFVRCYARDLQSLAAAFHALRARRAPRANGQSRAGLSRRESEVIAWSAAGKSYWEIGCILGLSERTVRFYMANAREKLDAASKTEAVAKAIRKGAIATR